MANDLEGILGENKPDQFEQTFKQAQRGVSAPTNLTQYKNNLKEAQENIESPNNIFNQLNQFGDNMIKNRQQYGDRDIVDWMGDKADNAIQGAKKFWSNLRGLRDEGEENLPPPPPPEAPAPPFDVKLNPLPEDIKTEMQRQENRRLAISRYQYNTDEDDNKERFGKSLLNRADENVRNMENDQLLAYIGDHSRQELESNPHNLPVLMDRLHDIFLDPATPQNVKDDVLNYYNSLEPAANAYTERVRKNAPAYGFSKKNFKAKRIHICLLRAIPHL
jgi:hypothetical protein